MGCKVTHKWLSVELFSELVGITDRHARRVCISFSKGKGWNDMLGSVRTKKGRGGRSGVRYEILLSSLPVHLQGLLGDDSEADTCAIAARRPSQHGPATLSPPAAPKFVAAANQAEAEHRRYAVLRLVMETERGTPERAQAIRDAARHHGENERTIQRWVQRCEAHGWDLDTLGRKRPEDAGQKRVWVSRAFDKRFRAAGYDQADLERLGDWLTCEIAGWWQSPVQRAGWKRVRLEVLTSLRRECATRGFDLPRTAFGISRRRVEELRFHRAVDVMKHDAKRHDDAKPRIRRDNSRFRPMEQVVMDVKPLDCVLMRPDGTLAYPKLIGFMDTGTHRLFGRIILLPQGEGVRQEHVTDAFLDMVDHPDWGFPQQLYCDNGSEYKHFDLIREALKMIADEGARVIIYAKPYSGASKPIESKFSVIDRQITSLMDGYTGSNRMDKKIHRMGQKAKPYAGSVEAFEEEFFLRLSDFHAMSIGSGPFKGKSPMEVYHGHLNNGWRPVRVNRLALDCAFAKQLGQRKIDRGAITISGERFRHSELAALAGRRVQVVKPYRREAWPLANLPDVGWVALEPEMLHLPGALDGAIEASRAQHRHNQAVRRLKSRANAIDPAANVRERVARLPAQAAPAPLIDVMLSNEAENFAGARIEAERRRKDQPNNAQRLIALQMEETEFLEGYIASRRAKS
jgi:transposase